MTMRKTLHSSDMPGVLVSSPHVQYVGTGFWNFRGDWMYKGILNIGTQMSVIQLTSGKFVVLDTILFTEEIKEAFEKLTDYGKLVEAVVLTHPFHIAHVPAFAKAYPDVEFYGCPRHQRKLPHLHWAGSVMDCRVRAKWFPEIDMRIPEGSEFVVPLPEKTNHMCGMFVYHAPSRTIHENDTIMIGYKPNIFLKIDGYKHLKMRFHQSITGPGLIPSPEAPFALKNWLLDIIEDWDFDNIAAGHMGCMIGGAKEELQNFLVRSEPLLNRLSKKLRKKGSASFIANGKFNLNLEADIFDGNLECECG